jgi:hypothetical protein
MVLRSFIPILLLFSSLYSIVLEAYSHLDICLESASMLVSAILIAERDIIPSLVITSLQGSIASFLVLTLKSNREADRCWTMGTYSRIASDLRGLWAVLSTHCANPADVRASALTAAKVRRQGN